MKKIGDNFSFIDFGPFEKMDQISFKHPKLTEEVPGKQFLKDELGLTSMEVSLNKFLAGTSMPFSHKHRENEELYIFLKGKGEFCVDGEWFEVQEGSVIKVAPNGVRTWRSSSSEELLYIVIQAKAGTLEGSSIQDGIPVKG
ncbi:MAG: cupin [Gammaproteobacteria bacterium]|jgi:mannose-6-phosphate isomerase-like protein (cupin superfamily)|nr:cupin [Gammaproteobacteria bacterium]